MRPPRTRSSPFAAPLDLLLGTPLRVRLLRALDDANDVRGTTQLAAQIGSDPPSVQRALEPLVDAGLVERLGGRRSAVYRIRTSHPLAAPLTTLFGAERERRSAIPQTVRAWAERASPSPLAVWLYGSVARGDDRPDSDVDLAVVAPDGSTMLIEMKHFAAPAGYDWTNELAESLREALDPVGRAMALSPSVVVLSPEELLALEHRQPTLWRALLEESEPLVGPRVSALVSRLRRQAKTSGTPAAEEESR